MDGEGEGKLKENEEKMEERWGKGEGKHGAVGRGPSQEMVGVEKQRM